MRMVHTRRLSMGMYNVRREVVTVKSFELERAEGINNWSLV